MKILEKEISMDSNYILMKRANVFQCVPFFNYAISMSWFAHWLFALVNIETTSNLFFSQYWQRAFGEIRLIDDKSLERWGVTQQDLK